MSQAVLCMRFAFFAAAIGAAASSHVSSAAKIEHISLGDGIELIAIEGTIAPGDQEKFRRLSVQHDDAVVALSSDGGALLPALEIGKMIRLKEFPTLVMDDYECTSACALIWIAGSTRFLAPGGRVGFHASYRDEGGRKVETGLGNALVGRYLTLLNLPEKAVLFATAAPPDRVLWLTSSTMRDAGIEFEEFGDEPTPPPIVRTNVAPPPVITQRASNTTTRSSKGDTERFGSVAHWDIGIDHTLREGCFLISKFTNGTVFRIGIDATGKGKYYLVLANPAWSSLKEGTTYDLSFKFDNESPWDVPSTAVRMGETLALMAHFSEPTFWGEFVRFHGLRVFKGGTSVTGISLAQTSRAFDELIKCQKAQLANQRTLDPFAQ